MPNIGQTSSYYAIVTPGDASNVSYQWSLDNGGNFVGATNTSSCTINWTSAGSFVLTVTLTNDCTGSAVTNTFQIPVAQSSYTATRSHTECRNFTRNNCESNCTGDTENVCKEGTATRSSNNSQAEADSLAGTAAQEAANALLDAQGQDQANANQACNCQCSPNYQDNGQYCDGNRTLMSQIDLNNCDPNPPSYEVNGNPLGCGSLPFNDVEGYASSTVNYTTSCASGCTGSVVSYFAESSVAVGTIQGASVAEANQNAQNQAQMNVDTLQANNGQNNANANGTCDCAACIAYTYSGPGQGQNGTVTYTNCSNSEQTVNVSGDTINDFCALEGQYSTTGGVSVNYLGACGQTSIYYNSGQNGQVTQTYYRGCGACGTVSQFDYTGNGFVEANTHTSTNSQQEANVAARQAAEAIAQQDVNDNGQAAANAYFANNPGNNCASISYENTTGLPIEFTYTDCSTNGTVTVTAPAGTINDVPCFIPGTINNGNSGLIFYAETPEC